MTLPSTDVRVHVTGEGPPVVLLHCLGVDHRLWDGVIDALGAGHRVLTYDLPGHGESATPPAGYSIDDLADQLAAVLDASGVSRAHVAGMSLGGCVAQSFAGRYPERVARLVLADTTPQYPPALKNTWIERASIARSRGVGPLVDEKLTIWFTPDFAAANGPQVRYVRDTLTACDGEGYALACEALGAADLRDSVRRISAPTLIALGDGDLPPFHDAARWMHDAIPGSRVQLIAGARHAAPLQQSAAFAALLRDFLDGT
jgi:3-oxoadipate enol-lactonase